MMAEKQKREFNVHYRNFNLLTFIFTKAYNDGEYNHMCVRIDKLEPRYYENLVPDSVYLSCEICKQVGKQYERYDRKPMVHDMFVAELIDYLKSNFTYCSVQKLTNQVHSLYDYQWLEINMGYDELEHLFDLLE